MKWNNASASDADEKREQSSRLRYAFVLVLHSLLYLSASDDTSRNNALAWIMSESEWESMTSPHKHWNVSPLYNENPVLKVEGGIRSSCDGKHAIVGVE